MLVWVEFNENKTEVVGIYACEQLPDPNGGFSPVTEEIDENDSRVIAFKERKNEQ
jgi:hypothetical protein